MADIVAAFCLPHDPLMASSPQINDQAKADTVFEAFDDVNRRIQALDVDTVIVIGSDHFCNFGPRCLPQYLIAVGNAGGPIEPWLGIDPYPIDVDTALATHIMNFGFDHGFDWAVAKDITLDHGTMVPIHLAVQPSKTGIKSIPIYTAAGVEPLLRSRRAYELGQMLGKAVAAYDGATRVAIMGTGGISHWVGTAEMGRVNESFDRMVLDKVLSGDVEALIAMSDEYLVETAGNGSLEIRNWIMAMGAVGAKGAELICYEPIPEWICGMGVVDLELSA